MPSTTMATVRFTIPSHRIRVPLSERGAQNYDSEPFFKHFTIPASIVAAHSRFVADILEADEGVTNDGNPSAKSFNVVSIDYGGEITSNEGQASDGTTNATVLDIPLEPTIGHCKNDVIALLCEWLLHFSGASAVYEKPHELLHYELMAIPNPNEELPSYQRCHSLLPFTFKAIGTPLTPPTLPSPGSMVLKPKATTVKDVPANYNNNAMYAGNGASEPSLKGQQLHTIHQQQQLQTWQGQVLEKALSAQQPPGDENHADRLRKQLLEYQQRQALLLMQALKQQDAALPATGGQLLPNIRTTSLLDFFERVLRNQWEASFIVFSVLFGEESFGPLETPECDDRDSASSDNAAPVSWQERAFNVAMQKVAGTTAAHLVAPADGTQESSTTGAIDPNTILRFHRRLHFLGSVALFLDMPRLHDLVSTVTAAMLLGVMQSRMVGANGDVRIGPVDEGIASEAISATQPAGNIAPKPFHGDGFNTLHSKNYGSTPATGSNNDNTQGVSSPGYYNPTHLASANQQTYSPFAHIRPTATGGEAAPQAARALDAAIALERQASVRKWFTKEGEKHWFSSAEQDIIKGRFSFEDATV